ncbi:hypothetical protein CCACVL1_25800, partial [Corchorus capsularis]
YKEITETTPVFSAIRCYTVMSQSLCTAMHVIRILHRYLDDIGFGLRRYHEIAPAIA